MIMRHAIVSRDAPMFTAGTLTMWKYQKDLSAPPGLLWADGQQVKITDYPELFAVIGYSCGPLDIEFKPHWTAVLMWRWFGVRYSDKQPNPDRPAPGRFRLPYLNQ